MISFLCLFFHLTFLCLRSITAVSISFYLTHLFSILLLLFLGLISNFDPLSPLSSTTFWTSALFASLSSPILSAWPTHVKLANFFLRFSLTPTSTLNSSILLLSVLLTPTILRTRLVSQTWTFSCFTVSAIVSSPFLYAAVTHERLYSITSSTFLQALNLPLLQSSL